MKKTQRGNILFLILLAVVLFAALAYAVTSSMRGGGKSASDEDLQMQISRIENHVNQVRVALHRMMLVGDIKPWQIDYADPTSRPTANTNCTTASCKLFDPAGGGVTGFALPAKYMPSSSECSLVNAYGGKAWFRNIGVKNVGIDGMRDLLILYPSVTKELCIAINNKYGVPNPSGNPPEDADPSGGGFTDYTGNISAEVALNTAPALGDEAGNAVAGHAFFCTKQTNNGCHYVWGVLLER